ncbi:MAG: hypothetical protein NT123_23605 [Proteobacteria bacterium]|nr:hypothetical protein [Pseudomonadota bacterium]
MKIGIVSGLLLCLTAFNVCAQTFTQSEFKDLFLAAFSYHTVARVCRDSDSIEKSAAVLRRVVNFGNYKNILSNEAKAYLRNPAEMIARGEEQYRKNRYVGCGQSKEIIEKLDQSTKQLP